MVSMSVHFRINVNHPKSLNISPAILVALSSQFLVLILTMATSLLFITTVMKMKSWLPKLFLYLTLSLCSLSISRKNILKWFVITDSMPDIVNLIWNCIGQSQKKNTESFFPSIVGATASCILLDMPLQNAPSVVRLCCFLSFITDISQFLCMNYMKELCGNTAAVLPPLFQNLPFHDTISVSIWNGGSHHRIHYRSPACKGT